jgi:glycosyltransferase involved in cell wall biosynthesis
MLLSPITAFGDGYGWDEDFKNMNKLTPDLVSIIVPVYNSSSYLHRCVNSILKQSYRDIEVILVDDGSTDGSGEICDVIARDDKRVRVLHTPNRGVSSARNTGINVAKGVFIFFVDSDDYIETYAVNALVEGYDLSHADIVVGAFNKVNDGSAISEVRDFTESQLLTRKDLIDYILAYLRNPRRHQLLMSSWAKLFRTEIIKSNNILFNTELRTAEDVAFNFDYLKNAETVFFIKEVIYNQQKLGTYNSLSMKFLEDDPRSLIGFIASLDNVSSFLLHDNPEIEIDKEIGHCYIYQIVLIMVRICGQINKSNKKKVYKFVDELINEPDFRHHIINYIPAEGNYQMIPFLMRLKLVWPVIGACWYEANKLYKKERDA